MDSMMNSAPGARPLHLIAGDVYRDWNKSGKGIYFGAVPYLEAMRSMVSIKNN